ncbi:MAG: NifU family protein [Deltaproteobacteria bacterium]|nr:NifU family protein [Deltaproteobacteria bacterium]
MSCSWTSSSPVVLLTLLALGCGPGTGGGGGSGTTDTGSTTQGDPSGDSTDGPSTSPGTSTTIGEDTTAGESGETTSGLNCMPGELPDCPLDSCLQQWEFDCFGCADNRLGEVSDPLCFAIEIGCTRPRLVCGDLPSPCDRVWAMGKESVESFESDDAAICMLQSLRDGIPGQYELMFGFMGDIGLVDIDLFTDGGGTVLMQYQDSCEGCPSSGYFGRSGALPLQDAAFFDACLTNPTTESLGDCLIGLDTWVWGAPPPVDWTPPFATGECVDLEWGCPTAG